MEYSPDGQEEHFRRLVTELTQPQWTGDFNALPGGSQAVIRVWATDGVNMAQATSGPFQVTPKPLKVFIQNPADGASYAAGVPVALQGSAYDPQTLDWLVSGKELVWKLPHQGVPGWARGATPAARGRHTLTLTAKSTFRADGKGQRAHHRRWGRRRAGGCDAYDLGERARASACAVAGPGPPGAVGLVWGMRGRAADGGPGGLRGRGGPTAPPAAPTEASADVRRAAPGSHAGGSGPPGRGPGPGQLSVPGRACWRRHHWPRSVVQAGSP